MPPGDVGGEGGAEDRAGEGGINGSGGGGGDSSGSWKGLEFRSL